MSRFLGYDPDDREEMHEERRATARMRHWCSTCLGHTGPGSPCAIEPEEEPDPEPEEDPEEES